MSQPTDPSRDDGYLIEFRRIGASVKVSAVDPRTGTEISMVGPASAGQAELSRLAVNKLEYVLARKRRGA